MDFVRSYFFMNATLTSCPFFFILSSLLGGFAVALLLHPPKNDDKMRKWATGQSCICKDATSYKIHTLKVGKNCSFLNLSPPEIAYVICGWYLISCIRSVAIWVQELDKIIEFQSNWIKDGNKQFVKLLSNYQLHLLLEQPIRLLS